MADKYFRLLLRLKEDELLMLWLSADKYRNESMGRSIRRRLYEMMSKDKQKQENEK